MKPQEATKNKVINSIYLGKVTGRNKEVTSGWKVRLLI